MYPLCPTQEIKYERAKEVRAKKHMKKVSTADLVEEVAARQRAEAAAAKAKVVFPPLLMQCVACLCRAGGVIVWLLVGVSLACLLIRWPTLVDSWRLHWSVGVGAGEGRGRFEKAAPKAAPKAGAKGKGKAKPKGDGKGAGN